MKATRDSWRTSPMPEQRERIEVSKHFSADEYERLAQGYVPESQDDRWFAYVDDDHVVHIHRSWTGNELYRARLEPAGDGWDVAEAWANRDPEQSNTTAKFDAGQLPILLDQLASGVGL